MEKNITEELIKFFMNQIRDLQRENAELRAKQSPECDCYHGGYCWGTKERDKCSCMGDRKQCNFY